MNHSSSWRSRGRSRTRSSTLLVGGWGSGQLGWQGNGRWQQSGGGTGWIGACLPDSQSRILPPDLHQKAYGSLLNPFNPKGI